VYDAKKNNNPAKPFKRAPGGSPLAKEFNPTIRNSMPTKKVNSLIVLYISLVLVSALFLLFCVDTIIKITLMGYINVIRFAEMPIERFKSSFR